jgi:hypothetical protein
MLLGCKFLPIANEVVSIANQIVANQNWCHCLLQLLGELNRIEIAVKGWGN